MSEAPSPGEREGEREREKERERGKTGVTADRDKIEFRLFNSSSIFNITLREELFSLPKKNQPCCLVLVSWCYSPESNSLERSW